MSVFFYRNALFNVGKETFCIEGIMPERALLRLKRAQIAVYNVKKTQKNQILLRVSKKDSQKVFAIFPNVCYNINEYTPYTVRQMPSRGLAKYVAFFKKRIGLLLGALLFCAVSLSADSWVFGVEFIGSDTYAREAKAALEQNGIKPFARYVEGVADLVAAQLLRLDGVEFCSVQKRGAYVRVEMRISPFLRDTRLHGDMSAKCSGTLLSITVLSGTLLKTSGEQVVQGQPLVGAYVTSESGEKKQVDVVARAYIACTYEEIHQADDEQQAFAQAYLSANVSDGDTLTEKSISKTEEGFCVRLSYVVTQTWNL